MKQVLLFGASGFIGRAILDELLQDAQLHITAMVHKTPLHLQHERLTLLPASVGRLSLSSLRQPPDVVIHAARNNTGRFGSIGRYIVASKGKRENQRLLDQLSSLETPPHIIYCSGSLMYGNHPGKWIDEDHADQPVSFARQYTLAEQPVKDAITAYKAPLTMLRLPWVIGNGSWFKWNYIAYILKNKRIPLYGEGNGQMCFIDVRSIARSLPIIMDARHNGLLNLFHAQCLSQKNWAEMLAGITGLPVHRLPDREWQALPVAVREAFNSSIILGSKYTSLQNELQALQPSLKETVQYYCSGMLHDV